MHNVPHENQIFLSNFHVSNQVSTCFYKALLVPCNESGVSFENKRFFFWVQTWHILSSSPSDLLH